MDEGDALKYIPNWYHEMFSFSEMFSLIWLKFNCDES